MTFVDPETGGLYDLDASSAGVSMSPTPDVDTDKISVALYVHGDGLDPDAITNLLGVDPTRAHRRGEVRTSTSDARAIAKKGLWAKILDSDGGKPEMVLERLLSDVSPLASKLRELPEVEDAYFDVFVGRITKPDGRADFELAIGGATLTALGASGLSLRITMAAVPR